MLNQTEPGNLGTRLQLAQGPTNPHEALRVWTKTEKERERGRENHIFVASNINILFSGKYSMLIEGSRVLCI